MSKATILSVMVCLVAYTQVRLRRISVKYCIKNKDEDTNPYKYIEIINLRISNITGKQKNISTQNVFNCNKYKDKSLKKI